MDRFTNALGLCWDEIGQLQVTCRDQTGAKRELSQNANDVFVVVGVSHCMPGGTNKPANP